MWQVLLYASGVAAALSLTAYCEERLAIMRDMPRRWVWPMMMVLSIAWAAGMVLWVGQATRDEAAAERTSAGYVGDQTAAFPQTAGSLMDSVAADAEPGALPSLLKAPSDRSVVVAWSAASALLIVWLVAGDLRLRRRAASWERASVLGRELLVSDSTGPALLGTWRPHIVVPRWFLAESPATQAIILEHEEQHRRARDPLLLRAALLLVVAMPWNLPLWWQLTRLRRAIELDCDARVLRKGAGAAAYGAVLLAVARKSQSVPIGVMAMARPVSQLERRIRSLTPDSARHSVGRATLAMLVWVAGMAAAIALEAPPLPERSFAPSRQAPVPGLGAAPAVAAAEPGAPSTPRRAAVSLPRLPPPIKMGEVPSRRESIERAIATQHPEFLEGPERDGTAFVYLRLKVDGGVETSESRFVEPGDAAGLASAYAAATGGRLLLARGWQIAGQATAKSQIVVSYQAAPGNLVAGGTLSSLPFSFADVFRVLRHHLPDAFSKNRLAGRTPLLVLSQDGRVVRSEYLSQGIPRMPPAQVPEEQQQRMIMMSSGPDQSVVIALTWLKQ